MDSLDAFDSQQSEHNTLQLASDPVFRSDSAQCPPLARPAPSYPHAFANILDHTAVSDQHPSFYDHQGVLRYGIDPSDVPSWSGSVDATRPMLHYNPTEPTEHVLGVAAFDRFPRDSTSPTPSTRSFPPPNHPSQHTQPQSSFSPHVFSNQQHLQAASQPPSKSASPAPSNPRHTFSVDLQAPKSQSVSSVFLPNATTKTEAVDTPWNLVPYHLPFTGARANGSPGGGSASAAGPNPSTGTSLFLRSPTPTKRQRTNQACEKCRDRKAKCNGARPTCQRCANRGLPCEYAKERRMRGPNKATNGYQNGGSPNSTSHQRYASSPAHAPQTHPAVSVHISTGQGTSPPANGRQGVSNNSPPPSGIAHHRKGLTGRPSASPRTLPTAMPLYRTIHVTQSHPDLHIQTGLPPASTAAPMTLPGLIPVGYSRPRAHTTPYPSAVNVPMHPSPLYNTVRTNTEFSSSETSEPPSATSSTFGVDMQVVYNVPRTGELQTMGPEYGAEAMGMGGPVGTLGLTNDGSSDTVQQATVTPIGNKFLPAADHGSSYSSPDTYRTTEFGDDMSTDVSTARWPLGYHLNVNTNTQANSRAFSGLSTGSQSASASSNPSTSSPGPYGYRSHSNQHSAGSMQDALGWPSATSQLPSTSSPRVPSSIPTIEPSFRVVSPKAEPHLAYSGPTLAGLSQGYDYPWNVDNAPVDASAYPRASTVTSGLPPTQSPNEHDFGSWFVDDIDGSLNGTAGSQHPKPASAGPGSPQSAVDAANGNVRNIAVLEIHD